MSAKASMIAAAAALGLVALAAALFTWWNNDGPERERSEPGNGAATVAAAGLEARLARIEVALDRLRSQAAAAPAVDAPAAKPPDGAERGDGAAAAVEDRVARLESRLETLETRLRGLEEDPISRGFAYMASTSSELRRQGIRLLGRVARSDPEARAAIRGLLADPDPMVREEAVETLAGVRDLESLPRFLELLDDGNVRVRSRAADRLGELLAESKDPVLVDQAARRLVERVADPDPAGRRAAIESLADLRSPAAAPAIIAALEDADDRVRAEAVQALARLGDPRAVQPLRALYDKASGEAALDLSLALRRLGNAEAFQREAVRLQEVALDDDADERRRADAVRVLARTDREAHRPLLQRLLEDPNPRVRREAERGLMDREREAN
jgi:HEAT repeat protein